MIYTDENVAIYTVHLYKYIYIYIHCTCIAFLCGPSGPTKKCNYLTSVVWDPPTTKMPSNGGLRLGESSQNDLNIKFWELCSIKIAWIYWSLPAPSNKWCLRTLKRFPNGTTILFCYCNWFHWFSKKSNEIDNIWLLIVWQLTTHCHIRTTSHSDSIGDQMKTIWFHKDWDRTDAILNFIVTVSPHLLSKWKPQRRSVVFLMFLFNQYFIWYMFFIYIYIHICFYCRGVQPSSSGSRLSCGILRINYESWKSMQWSWPVPGVICPSWDSYWSLPWDEASRDDVFGARSGKGALFI